MSERFEDWDYPEFDEKENQASYLAEVKIYEDNQG